MLFRSPWRKPAAVHAVPERKASQYGFVALHVEGEARWTRRDYAGLAREGFMRNPIAHRAVRMISEAAAAMPWLVYEGAADLDAHPLLDLLERPNAGQAGAAFMEALYGHLLISGNAYLQLIDGGEARASCTCCGRTG
jgi:phage portal protein BeeE